MRRLLPIAVVWLVGGCSRPEAPESIQDLLARTPIPTDKLREILFIGPEELRIEEPALARPLKVLSKDAWALRNVGRRSLWLHRKELCIDLCQGERPPFLMSWENRPSPVQDISRPVFNPEEWVLLRPGEILPLQVRVSGTEGGRMWYAAHLGSVGYGVWQEGVEFNSSHIFDVPPARFPQPGLRWVSGPYEEVP